MDVPTLLLNVATVVIAGVWLGAIIFHGMVVAPTAFENLDQAHAGRFLRALFPRYYRLGLVCGTLITSISATAALRAGWPPTMLWQLGASILMTGLTLYSLRIIPAINAARDAGASASARFHTLHRRAVSINFVVLGLVVAIAVVSASNPSLVVRVA